MGYMSMNSKSIEVDVLVIGAGITGLAVAASAAQAGLSVCLLDRKLPKRPVNMPIETPQAWVSALAKPAIELLQSLDLWPSLIKRACSYQKMHIKMGLNCDLKLSSHDIGEQSLGYIVENAAIREALWVYCSNKPGIVTVMEDLPERWCADDSCLKTKHGVKVNAQICVGADGTGSWSRKEAGIVCDHDENIDDIAWVGTFTHTNMHEATARQCFDDDGVLGLLPSYDYHKSIFVWSVKKEKIPHDESKVIDSVKASIEQSFPSYGTCSVDSSMRQHVIHSQGARSYWKNHIVLVGDAATSVHPLAGQGLNIGLRQAILLTRQLKKAKRAHRRLSDHYYLSRYAKSCQGYDALSRKIYQQCRLQGGQNHGIIGRVLNFGTAFVNQSQWLKRILIDHALHADMPAD